MEYPAMLFKAQGTMFLWDGEMFDHLIVNDADEAKAALADGWSVGKPEATAGTLSIKDAATDTTTASPRLKPEPKPNAKKA